MHRRLEPTAKRGLRGPLIAATLGIALAVLAGCAVGPNYHEPPPPQTGPFAGRELVGGVEGSIDVTWWKQFNDPLLDELVTTAVRANFSIAAAQARLRQARASRNAQRFDYLPRITASASYTDSRTSRAAVDPSVPLVQNSELYDAGFDATWELDLFGRVRRLNQSARAAAQAAEAARNDVALSVIAEVARNYFELRGAQTRLTVAQRNADTQTRALGLVRDRESAGRGTLLDSARAEAEVETTLASVPPLEADVERAMRRIEVLTGQAPGALAARLATAAPIPELPATLVLGSAADLLRRRPDVRTAERQVAAASARVGVAVADLFPRVTFNGRIALQAPDIDDLDAHGNDAHSFGPSISWAFLDFGRVWQEMRVADARSAEALADYQQTVLQALEETENALSDFGRERRRLEHLQRAARASTQASDLATQRFEGGVADFLTALDAYRTSLDTEDRYVQSQTDAATNLIALFKALGGGWEIVTSDRDK